MVVSSRFVEATGVVAGVEQREAAGAVGRFHHAGREAGLADRRRLLVARNAAGWGSRAPKQIGLGDAEIAGAVAHLRQQRARHAEQIAAIRRPRRRVRCRRAACARRWWRPSRAPCRR